MDDGDNGVVELDVRSDGVGVLTLRRPPVNAISSRVCLELADLVSGAVDDPAVRALVVWGGRKVFAAGADIKEFPDWGPEEARAGAAVLHRCMDTIAGAPMPSIAAVTGYALGGGFELALACDFRMVASDATVGFPEILLGLLPGAGGTQRLARLVGPARAKELVLSGRMVGAEEAFSLGLADTLVDGDDLFDAAVARAAGLAAGPASTALAKRAIDEGLDLPLDQALALERDLFAASFATRDMRIGVASFLEHGPGRAAFEHE